MANLSQLDTIVILFLENRSFDHLLGHLSLPPHSWVHVNGLQNDPAWLAKHANPHEGALYQPFELGSTYIPEDPPHERDHVALQLGATLTPTYPMNGFAQCYSQVLDFTPANPPAVMGYYTAQHVPIAHFFAQNYALCDNWFCSLPTGTQPNRFMAMAGTSPIDRNKSVLSFPNHAIVYNWLEQHNVRWRVYSDGLPFFFLMPEWRSAILTDKKHFRSVQDLAMDVRTEDSDTFPQVIFVEPCYTDDPFHGPANDDHPTTPVDAGQAFLARVYKALASTSDRWKRMALIVSYDEHGGFFDHVSPLTITTNAPNQEYAPFASTGPRVPSFVISPLVSARRVFKSPLDHTSILKLLGDKFGNGSYSHEVDGRAGVQSLAGVFDLSVPRPDVPMPPPSDGILPRMTINSEAFLLAGLAARGKTPKRASRFPGLWSEGNA